MTPRHSGIPESWKWWAFHKDYSDYSQFLILEATRSIEHLFQGFPDSFKLRICGKHLFGIFGDSSFPQRRHLAHLPFWLFQKSLVVSGVAVMDRYPQFCCMSISVTSLCLSSLATWNYSLRFFFEVIGIWRGSSLELMSLQTWKSDVWHSKPDWLLHFKTSPLSLSLHIDFTTTQWRWVATKRRPTSFFDLQKHGHVSNVRVLYRDVTRWGAFSSDPEKEKSMIRSARWFLESDQW